MIIRTPPKTVNKETFLKYISVDLWSWLRDLSTGLLRIEFLQNFQCFEVDNLTIKAGVEIAIPNQFSRMYRGTIPRYRIIVRQTGDANIIDGDKPWTNDLVYLKNPSGNDAKISVIFFR